MYPISHHSLDISGIYGEVIREVPFVVPQGIQYRKTR